MSDRRERRPVKKGVPVGLTVTIAAICSAIAFSGAYVYAMHTFNSKVTDLNEKQRMFTKLYEVDSAVRENYKGSIDEETLRESLSSTYVKSVDMTTFFMFRKVTIMKVNTVRTTRVSKFLTVHMC